MAAWCPASTENATPTVRLIFFTSLTTHLYNFVFCLFLLLVFVTSIFCLLASVTVEKIKSVWLQFRICHEDNISGSRRCIIITCDLST